MELVLKAVDTVNVEPYINGYDKTLKVEISGVSESDVLDQFSTADIISHFGAEKLLDSIGRDDAIAHFDLGPEEEG